MKYEHIILGTFISRPNRFIAHVAIPHEKDAMAGGSEAADRAEGTDQMKIVVCHVKNTGRCRELLLPGVTVILQFHPEAAALGRKTEYSLIGVLKERNEEPLLINMDSQAPNQVAAEWIHGMKEKPILPLSGRVENGSTFTGQIDCGFTLENIRREVTYGQSRFDLAFDLALGEQKKPAFMEVKGVTLEEDGIAMFPDAPTERGVKHILELAEAVKAGYESYILFVIQMKGIKEFTPNEKTHPQFGDALRLAKAAGVHILAFDCIVTEDSLRIDSPVPVRLS